VRLKKGDLIRWIIDHDMYAVSGSDVQPIKPVYAYGIIIDVSLNDSKNVVVCRLEKDGSTLIMHMIHDGFEIVSSTKDTEKP